MSEIKTWQERCLERGIGSCEARDEELIELRAALAERDAKLAALEEDVVTEEMKMAVRWAPSSAYWSTVLVNHFGPDARDGINSLEKQLREKIAAAGAASVPEGWQLVPTEPTPEMCAEGLEDEGCTVKDGKRFARALYSAMLAAAPKEPT